MSDIQTIELNDIQSTCVVDSYTVVDTPRTPVHNTPCPLHGCTTPRVRYMGAQHPVSATWVHNTTVFHFSDSLAPR